MGGVGAGWRWGIGEVGVGMGGCGLAAVLGV